MVDLGVVPKLSFVQRFVLAVSGSVFVGYRRPVGFTGVVAVHVVKCSRHGLFLDYPHGRGNFQCTQCLAESRGVHC